MNTLIRKQARLQVTATEARSELQRANTWLRQAVENALEMKAAASEIPASLERIADSLNSVTIPPIDGDLHLLKSELEVLRSRMGQLQMLLDGAAAFYCASIAHGRSADAQSYTARGQRAIAIDTHQMHLEA